MVDLNMSMEPKDKLRVAIETFDRAFADAKALRAGNLKFPYALRCRERV